MAFFVLVKLLCPFLRKNLIEGAPIRPGPTSPRSSPAAAALLFVRGRVPVARFAAPVPALPGRRRRDSGDPRSRQTPPSHGSPGQFGQVFLPNLY